MYSMWGWLRSYRHAWWPNCTSSTSSTRALVWHQIQFCTCTHIGFPLFWVHVHCVTWFFPC